MIAWAQVLEVEKTGVLSRLSEIPGVVCLDPKVPPFRRRHITEMRKGHKILKCLMYEETSSGQREREF